MHCRWALQAKRAGSVQQDVDLKSAHRMAPMEHIPNNSCYCRVNYSIIYSIIIFALWRVGVQLGSGPNWLGAFARGLGAVGVDMC